MYDMGASCSNLSRGLAMLLQDASQHTDKTRKLFAKNLHSSKQHGLGLNPEARKVGGYQIMYET